MDKVPSSRDDHAQQSRCCGFVFPGRRRWAVITALSLSVAQGGLGVSSVQAAGWSAEAPREVKGDRSDATTRTRLKTLHRKGSAAYSASDYRAAIEAFSSMLALLEQNATERSVTIRGATLFNLGRSYHAAYDLELDERNLRLARDIFKRYLREAKSGYAYKDGAAVKKLLAEVEAKLKKLADSRAQEAEAKRKEKNAAENRRLKVEAEKIAALNKAERAALERRRKKEREQDSAFQAKQKKKYKTIGWTAMGLGAVGTGIGVLGIVAGKSASKQFSAATDPDKREAINARGKSMNIMAYVGLSTAVVGVGVGAWMLSKANKKKSSRRAHLRGLWLGSTSGFEIAF